MKCPQFTENPCSPNPHLHRCGGTYIWQHDPTEQRGVVEGPNIKQSILKLNRMFRTTQNSKISIPVTSTMDFGPIHYKAVCWI